MIRRTFEAFEVIICKSHFVITTKTEQKECNHL